MVRHLYNAVNQICHLINAVRQTGPAFSLGHIQRWHSRTLACSHTAMRSPSLPFVNDIHPCNPCKYQSLTQHWPSVTDIVLYTTYEIKRIKQGDEQPTYCYMD